MDDHKMAIKIARFLAENQATTDQRIDGIVNDAKDMIRNNSIPPRQKAVWVRGRGWKNSP